MYCCITGAWAPPRARRSPPWPSAPPARMPARTRGWGASCLRGGAGDGSHAEADVEVHHHAVRWGLSGGPLAHNNNPQPALAISTTSPNAYTHTRARPHAGGRSRIWMSVLTPTSGMQHQAIWRGLSGGPLADKGGSAHSEAPSALGKTSWLSQQHRAGARQNGVRGKCAP